MKRVIFQAGMKGKGRVRKECVNNEMMGTSFRVQNGCRKRNERDTSPITTHPVAIGSPFRIVLPRHLAQRYH